MTEALVEGQGSARETKALASSFRFSLVAVVTKNTNNRVCFLESPNPSIITRLDFFSFRGTDFLESRKREI